MVLAADPNQATFSTKETSWYHLDKRDSPHGIDAVSFRNIGTNMNGPLLLSKCYIAAPTHD